MPLLFTIRLLTSRAAR